MGVQSPRWKSTMGVQSPVHCLPYDSTRMFSKEFDVQNERLLWNRNNLIQCLRGERSGAH